MSYSYCWIFAPSFSFGNNMETLVKGEVWRRQQGVPAAGACLQACHLEAGSNTIAFAVSSFFLPL